MNNLESVKQRLNDVAKSKGFQCVNVSWEDAQRGTVGGTLSSWGGNISDVRLYEKTGKLLYTLRSQNWNERLGYVSSKDVAVVTGNYDPSSKKELKTVNLRNFLENFGTHGKSVGVPNSVNLSQTETDDIFSVRFQTVFLPVEEKEKGFFESLASIFSKVENTSKVEFCTDVYNYNTHSDTDPRNLIMLCTPQGTSIQQDGSGSKKLFFHTYDGSTVERHWLEAERSIHKVGGEQKETEEEKEDALKRNKATAITVGTRAMGNRFNVQMMIQLPMKMKKLPDRSGGSSQSMSFLLDTCGASLRFASRGSRGAMPCSVKTEGVSNAARVSQGTLYDKNYSLTTTEFERDNSQHSTITITLYYTVANGVPSEQDVLAAVNDLDNLYKSCRTTKELSQATEITKELTVKDMMDIKTKVVTQPHENKFIAPKTNGFPEYE
jgi:hypothetical protein